jgi:hypothetical protein
MNIWPINLVKTTLKRRTKEVISSLALGLIFDKAIKAFCCPFHDKIALGKLLGILSMKRKF